MTRIVDLSQEIYQGMPVYPGHLRTVIWDDHVHDDTADRFEGGFSYATKGLLLSDHGPTHVDAPSHLDPAAEAPSIEALALDRFYGAGVCLDVSHRQAFEDITAGDLEHAVERSRVGVPGQAIVLLRTATVDRVGGTGDYTTRYPGLDESACEWLARLEVKAFGVDSPSPDNPASKTYPAHMMCRRTGILHYENLANLDQLLDEPFTFVGFPLRIRGATGSPVRAVAFLETFAT